MKAFIFSEISIDGKLSLNKGISSKFFFEFLDEEDLKFIHRYRYDADAIMVGNNTINIDNPFLTNRFFSDKQPIRIIPTNTLNIDLKSNVFLDKYQTLIITCNKNRDTEMSRRIESCGKECLFFGEEEIDFQELFHYLEHDLNIKNVMIEGGGTLNSVLLKSNLIDEINLMILPIIIGGKNNISLVEGDGITSISQISHFKLDYCEPRDRYVYLKYKKSYEDRNIKEDKS